MAFHAHRVDPCGVRRRAPATPLRLQPMQQFPQSVLTSASLRVGRGSFVEPAERHGACSHRQVSAHELIPARGKDALGGPPQSQGRTPERRKNHGSDQPRTQLMAPGGMRPLMRGARLECTQIADKAALTGALRGGAILID